MSAVTQRFRIAQDATTSPTETQLRTQKVIRDLIVEAALEIEQSTPPSREQSTALTKLEEALLWVGKAVFL